MEIHDGRVYNDYKEREKCRQVADAFCEYFDEMDDTTIVDAGKFGYLWLRWFDGDSFDGHQLYTDSQEMFEDLWQAWLEHHLLTPVLHTPAAEMEYDQLYDILTPEQKEIYAKKKEYFRKKHLAQNRIDMEEYVAMRSGQTVSFHRGMGV